MPVARLDRLPSMDSLEAFLDIFLHYQADRRDFKRVILLLVQFDGSSRV